MGQSSDVLAARRVGGWRNCAMRTTANRRIGGPAGLALGVLAAALVAGPASGAGAPDHFGPFDQEYSFIGFECEGFEVLIEGTGTDEYTIWYDESGQPEKLLWRARYPHDTLTNLSTGKSIVVRGMFQEWLVRDPATGDFMKTINGFRYMVNRPGDGVIIRDVGRITYGDLDQTIVTWQAGKHELAFDAQIPEAFCGALG